MSAAEATPGKFVLGHYSKVGDELKGGRDLEDRCDCRTLTTAGGLKLLVGVVADGVGGNRQGELAAQTALDATYDSLEKSTGSNIPILLENAVLQANQEVFARTQGSQKISTTLVVAVVYQDRAYVANVGDSRAYLVRKGKLTQLTRDHNFALINKVSPNHPNASVLVRAMGLKPTVEPDLGFYVGTDDETVALERGVQGLPLKPGDAILLCSDGLVKSKGGVRYAKDEEIVEATEREFAANMAARAMVSIATGREANDNVSAVTIQYLDPALVAEAQSKTQAYRQRQQLVRYAILGGGVLLGLLVIVLAVNLVVLQNQPTATPVIATPQIITKESTRVITNTPAPTQPPTPTATATTQPVAANERRIEEVQGAVMVLDPANVESPAVAGSPLIPGSKITVGPNSGIRILVGDAGSGASPEVGMIYLYADSSARLTLESKLNLELLSGAAFVQPAPNRSAEVKLPNHNNIIASVTGSRMVVDLRPAVGGVRLYCFEGTCRLAKPDLTEVRVPVGQWRTFHPDTGVMDEPKPMTYEEQWQLARWCSACLGMLVPTPTVGPKASATPSPEASGSRPNPGQPTAITVNPVLPTTPVPPPTVITPATVPTTAVPSPVVPTVASGKPSPKPTDKPVDTPISPKVKP